MAVLIALLFIMFVRLMWLLLVAVAYGTLVILYLTAVFVQVVLMLILAAVSAGYDYYKKAKMNHV